MSISKVVEFLTEGLPIFDNGILMGFYIKICFIGHRVVWYGEEMGLDKRHFAPCCGQTGVSERPSWTRYYKVQNNEIYVDPILKCKNYLWKQITSKHVVLYT